MSGHKSGLQALLNSHLGRLIIYIHCFCHRLALVVKDALNSIPFIHEHYSVVSSLYNHFKLKDISDLYDGNSLKRLIETRWSGHLATIKAIDNDLQNVINCLYSTSTDRSVEVQHRAISLGLYHQVCNSSYILFNKILKEILEILNIASLTFQSKGSNITANMEIVNECQREIDNISSVYNTDKICQDLQYITSIMLKGQAETEISQMSCRNVLWIPTFPQMCPEMIVCMTPHHVFAKLLSSLKICF